MMAKEFSTLIINSMIPGSGRIVLAWVIFITKIVKIYFSVKIFFSTAKHEHKKWVCSYDIVMMS